MISAQDVLFTQSMNTLCGPVDIIKTLRHQDINNFIFSYSLRKSLAEYSPTKKGYTFIWNNVALQTADINIIGDSIYNASDDVWKKHTN